jgi:hypothetical protein
VINSILTFIQKEKRWWVIAMIFLMGLAYAFQDVIVKQFEKDPIPTQVKASTTVNKELGEVMIASGASRVYVFQFHNGITFYTGQHAQRFSCTYEMVAEGISREAENLQNLQVSLFSWWINEVLSGRMTYYNIEDMADYTSRITLQQQGIKSIICRPLIHKGKVVGIVGMDFVGSNDDIVNNPQFVRDFENMSSKIAKMISE